MPQIRSVLTSSLTKQARASNKRAVLCRCRRVVPRTSHDPAAQTESPHICVSHSTLPVLRYFTLRLLSDCVSFFKLNLFCCIIDIHGPSHDKLRAVWVPAGAARGRKGGRPRPNVLAAWLRMLAASRHSVLVLASALHMK